MMKFFFLGVFVTHFAYAYIPTVESLLRHGGNPDVTSNGLVLTFSVKNLHSAVKSTAVQDVALTKDQKEEDFYKIYITKISNEAIKVAQVRYSNNSFSEGSLENKVYYPHFSAGTLKGIDEQSEKGIFFGVLRSLLLNNGSHLLNYLKSLEVPVRLNQDLINREKIELLADYKRYLAAINKDRNAKKTMENPLRPENPAARERAEKIMNESMYVDTHQVTLSREDGQMAWLIKAGNFEAVVSYKEREIQRVKYKSSLGEFEIICKDYWLLNGTHSMPRRMFIKDFKGNNFQVDFTNLRHYVEKDEDISKRLSKWDQILKGKETTSPRPDFLL